MSGFQTINRVPGLPERAADGHKGTFGTVIVLGGCPTMIGAPGLCAAASLRSGVGLVKVACDASILPFVLSIEPGATGVVLGADGADVGLRLDEADVRGAAVLAVGPGIGCSDAAGVRVAGALRGSRFVVLDADGLNLLAKGDLARGRGGGPGLVLTPHVGEYRRLAEPLGISRDPTSPTDRAGAAMELAAAHGAVVVLKGPRTVVADGTRLYTNTTGNPALATAGSGDVLTGLIAGLVAQGMGGFEASVLGVYLHGLAGDLWAKQHGQRGMTARDLVGLLPFAFDLHEQNSR